MSFIGAGTCVINANQAGNGTYNPAPQVQQSFLVVKQNQTIAFTSTPPAMARIGGPTYTVTATATSGLTVTFAIDPSAAAVCTIAGSTVSFIGGGTCVINANQAGNGTYNPAPQVQQSFHVNFPPQLPNAVTYTTPGNTQLHVAGATLPGVASWADAVALLAKSGATDPDNGPGSLSVVAASGVTGNGGSYSIFANGSFTFVPGTGFTGADSFTFQVTDTLDTTTGTVNVTVGQRVWYIRDVIDANNAAGGDGRSTNAFDSIAAFNAATTNNGDIIYVFEGNTGTTPHVGSISLKDGQKLWGQGIALNVPGFGTPLVAAANKARIRTTAASTDVVSVPATAGSRSNVEIRGLDLEATGATSNAIDVTSSGGNTVGITISNNNVRGATAEGIDLNAGATAAFSATVQSNTVTSAGNGIDTRVNASGTATVTTSSNMITSTAGNAFDARTLAGASALRVVLDDSNVAAAGNGIVIDGSAAGTTTITGFANNVVDGSTVGTGISITSAIFDGAAGAPFTAVNGGTAVIGASGNGVGLGGMILASVLGDLSFTDLDIYNEGGTGLGVTSTGAINAGAGTGFRIGVTANVATIDSNGGPAVAVNNASFNLPALNFLRSTNSPSNGLSLVNAFGGAGSTTLSANSGLISDPVGASGTAVNISGGNGNITLGIPVTNTSGNAVVVTSRTSDTVSFTGAINETGSGISLTNNAGATNSFSGGITANTGANPAFTATGPGPLATSGGTVTVTGSTNTLQTSTGIALNVVHTTIGASGLTFRSISANGAASGIVLNNTGATGGLAVTGNAGSCTSLATCTGGAIQNTTSHGVRMTSTLAPTFTRVGIQNTAGSGIEGTAVNGFTLQNSFIDNSGTGGSPDDSNVAFNDQAAGTETNVSGTLTITNNILTNARWHGIMVQNFNGTLNDAVVTGNTITSGTTLASSLGYAINFQILGSATTVSNLTKATISSNTITNFPSAGGIQVQGGNSNAAGVAGTVGVAGSGTNIISITNNSVRGQSAANRMNTSAILYTVSGKGQGNVDISNNGTLAVPLANTTGTTIGVGANGETTLTATTNNNFIEANHPGTSGSTGISGGTGVTFGVTDTPDMTWTINNNVIRNVDGNGILATARGATGLMKVKIQNNDVEAPQAGVRPGIRVDAGNTTAGSDDDVCLNISGNTSAGSGGSQGIGLRKQGTSSTVHAFGVNGMGATSTPGVETFVNGLNPAGSATLLISATSGFSNCSLP
ncbi:MAG TPA: Ig-like domain-containing protein [Thermoanaerobaculia bacterium]|nr:Ig-like domain-containing protein [Thermoanaerobaculia bacterium]